MISRWLQNQGGLTGLRHCTCDLTALRHMKYLSRLRLHNLVLTVYSSLRQVAGGELGYSSPKFNARVCDITYCLWHSWSSIHSQWEGKSAHNFTTKVGFSTTIKQRCQCMVAILTVQSESRGNSKSWGIILLRLTHDWFLLTILQQLTLK